MYHLNFLVQLLHFVGIKLVNSFNVNERFSYDSETIPSEFVTRPRRSRNHHATIDFEFSSNDQILLAGDARSIGKSSFAV